MKWYDLLFLNCSQIIDVNNIGLEITKDHDLIIYKFIYITIVYLTLYILIQFI